MVLSRGESERTPVLRRCGLAVRRRAAYSACAQGKRRGEDYRGMAHAHLEFRHAASMSHLHVHGIDAGSMAQAMGHSLEVHCRSYPWASVAGTIAAFDRANAAVAMASTP